MNEPFLFFVLCLFPVTNAFTSADYYEPPLSRPGNTCRKATISNGSMLVKHEGRLGVTKCNKGYRLIGDKRSLCHNSQWSSLPKCIRRVKCPSLTPKVPNGRIVVQNFTFYKVVCNPGFAIPDGATAVFPCEKFVNPIGADLCQSTTATTDDWVDMSPEPSTNEFELNTSQTPASVEEMTSQGLISESQTVLPDTQADGLSNGAPLSASGKPTTQVYSSEQYIDVQSTLTEQEARTDHQTTDADIGLVSDSSNIVPEIEPTFKYSNIVEEIRGSSDRHEFITVYTTTTSKGHESVGTTNKLFHVQLNDTSTMRETSESKLNEAASDDFMTTMLEEQVHNVHSDAPTAQTAVPVMAASDKLPLKLISSTNSPTTEPTTPLRSSPAQTTLVALQNESTTVKSRGSPLIQRSSVDSYNLTSSGKSSPIIMKGSATHTSSSTIFFTSAKPKVKSSQASIRVSPVTQPPSLKKLFPTSARRTITKVSLASRVSSTKANLERTQTTRSQVVTKANQKSTRVYRTRVSSTTRARSKKVFRTSTKASFKSNQKTVKSGLKKLRTTSVRTTTPQLFALNRTDETTAVDIQVRHSSNDDKKMEKILMTVPIPFKTKEVDRRGNGVPDDYFKSNKIHIAKGHKESTDTNESAMGLYVLTTVGTILLLSVITTGVIFWRRRAIRYGDGQEFVRLLPFSPGESD